MQKNIFCTLVEIHFLPLSFLWQNLIIYEGQVIFLPIHVPMFYFVSVMEVCKVDFHFKRIIQIYLNNGNTNLKKLRVVHYKRKVKVCELRAWFFL